MITYEREISHCEPTKHVKEVTVKNIVPAENSDNLVVITFNEIGWQVVEKRGEHVIGQRVIYFPPECVLPLELSELLGVTSYLSKGRVKAITLRNNRSEGLIADPDKTKDFIEYILQWEDPPTVTLGGDKMRNAEIPQEFKSFYKMPNLLNEPNLFINDDMLVISEKIHGTNARFGWLKNPLTEEYQLYVGSHNVVLADTSNIYYKTVSKCVENIALPKDIVFYGEIYGPGIQKKMTYGLKIPELKIFAVSAEGRYKEFSEVIKICNTLNLPVVSFIKVFSDIDILRSFANAPSEYNEKFREGIVITSINNPNIMAKLKSDEYLNQMTR